ncbi:CHAT domain-containing protein [Microbacterium sp. MYb66]|uniref:CHAT domain-containing protein n=1 Tax=Microbacterium sp. MYb66 TaxID=1848692 RepID=UPI000D00C18F|nr:CHAT domain-containing protein [Microbacterium sp. MYb66]PRA82075.1 hypothetical protein CQ045_05095 [Microbacterium sp. MYb66]
MSRSDTLRSDIARLESKKATLSATIAKNEKAAATARVAAQKKRDAAARTKNDSTRRSSLTAASREDTKVAAAEKNIAGARKDLATVDKTIASKMASLRSAESSEQRATATRARQEASSRRQAELTHARAVARASVPTVIRYTPVEPPKQEKLRVLYVTSNPRAIEYGEVDEDGTVSYSREWLRVEQELRQVKKSLRGSRYRDQVEVLQLPAATINDLIEGLNDHRPHVIHFSGHASYTGLLMENEAGDEDGAGIDFKFLARVLSVTDSPPELVVLNACESLGGAAELLTVAPVIIGMSDTIGDDAAIVFASAFYAAIASAQSVGTALRQAKVKMEAEGVGDHHLPKLGSRDDVDPDALVLVEPAN